LNNLKIKIQRFVIEKVELLLFLLFGFIYFTMAIFGRGDYWNSFEHTNLIAIILCLPIVFVINAYLLIPFFAKTKNGFFMLFY